VIWLSPGTPAETPDGIANGRVSHVVGGHCPAAVPAGKAADATRVDQLFVAVLCWLTYQNVQSSNGSTLMLE
jgi:hypothetical protein